MKKSAPRHHHHHHHQYICSAPITVRTQVHYSVMPLRCGLFVKFFNHLLILGASVPTLLHPYWLNLARGIGSSCRFWGSKTLNLTLLLTSTFCVGATRRRNKVECDYNTAKFPYPTISKLFPCSNALMAKSLAQFLSFISVKDKEKQTKIRHVELFCLRRCTKSEPHRGDRGNHIVLVTP